MGPNREILKLYSDIAMIPYAYRYARVVHAKGAKLQRLSPPGATIFPREVTMQDFEDWCLGRKCFRLCSFTPFHALPADAPAAPRLEAFLDDHKVTNVPKLHTPCAG
jgi:hypothetical protein